MNRATTAHTCAVDCSHPNEALPSSSGLATNLQTRPGEPPDHTHPDCAASRCTETTCAQTDRSAASLLLSRNVSAAANHRTRFSCMVIRFAFAGLFHVGNAVAAGNEFRHG